MTTWKISTLGQECDIVNGGTPKTGVREYWGGKYRWITPAEMGKRISPYVEDTERTLTELGLQNSSARILPPHSVILSSRAPIGHLVINTEPMATNQGCKGLIPGQQLQCKFLYYYLSSIVGLLDSLGTGATFKELSGGKLKEVNIPVPPQSDQKRIVQKLDEAFAGIAKAKENAERNLQNARALFESQLKIIFSNGSKDWPETMLGAVAEVQSGGTPTVSVKAFWGGNIPWYSSGELNNTQTKDPERTITETGLNNSNAKLFPKNSLLIGMYDTAALKMSILEREGAFNQAIAGVKPNERIETEFILHAINAIKPKLLLERRGVRQKNLSLGKIKAIKIPLPPIQKQRTVAAALSSLMAETQRLTLLYEQKQVALETLKKSILHEAFSGNI